MTAAIDDTTCTLQRGTQPLLISIPHCGREIPAGLRDDLVLRALAVEDTDWHLDRLYDFVRDLGASLLVPRYSRYVIDLNRPPDNAPMYPGANNTELCPTHFFTGDALYREGRAPDDAQIAQRRERYWRPYHTELEAELARLKGEHGHAVLFDAHSIKSELPWLFEGKLPDLNVGTAGGASCAPSLRSVVSRTLAAQTSFSFVVDGRFKGGYVTRRYGRPHDGVHAVQLEMCWHCYIAETAPWSWDEAQAARVQPVLRTLVQTLLAWRQG